jgi:hypothetical protein
LNKLSDLLDELDINQKNNNNWFNMPLNERIKIKKIKKENEKKKKKDINNRTYNYPKDSD